MIGTLKHAHATTKEPMMVVLTLNDQNNAYKANVLFISIKVLRDIIVALMNALKLKIKVVSALVQIDDKRLPEDEISEMHDEIIRETKQVEAH